MQFNIRTTKTDISALANAGLGWLALDDLRPVKVSQSVRWQRLRRWERR